MLLLLFCVCTNSNINMTVHRDRITYYNIIPRHKHSVNARKYSRLGRDAKTNENRRGSDFHTTDSDTKEKKNYKTKMTSDDAT